MKRVLVIDDEIDICILLTRHLKSYNFYTEYALCMEDALSKDNLHSFDLFIIDLNLKDGSGYNLMATLKSKKIQSEIIMISAYDNEAKRAIEQGASHFIPKPLSKKTFDEVLHKTNLF